MSRIVRSARSAGQVESAHITEAEREFEKRRSARCGQPNAGNAAHHPIAASTVWQILHDAGTGPAPRRAGPAWRQFLAAQARSIVAVGFVHVDTVLLRRVYALIVIEHGTRRAHLAGVTANPDGAWTTQAARNLLMNLGQCTSSARFSEHHLRQVLTEYLRHYSTARPHRALGQLTPAQAGTCPPEPVNLTDHCVRPKQVLGGLTHEYYAAA